MHYITYEGLRSPVFSSQVASVVSQIARRRLTQLVIFDSDEKMEPHDHLINTVSPATIVIIRKGGIIKDIAAIRKAISVRGAVVHCRSPLVAIMAYIAGFGRKWKLLCDYRGVAEEHLVHKNYLNRIFRYAIFRNIERVAYLLCDRASFVSTSMLRHIVKRPSQKTMVAPCAVDVEAFKYSEEKRQVVRDALKIPKDEMVFIYSGGTQWYQGFNECVEFYWKMRNHLDASRLLVLTPHIESAKRQIQISCGEHPSNILVEHVSHSDVTSYLCAADVAIMIRPNDIVNKVASPTKMAEYLCSGLFVVGSSAVDTLYEEFTENPFLGLLYDGEGDFENLASNLSSNARNTDRIRRTNWIAHSEYALSINIEKYHAAYHEMDRKAQKHCI